MKNIKSTIGSLVISIIGGVVTYFYMNFRISMFESNPTLYKLEFSEALIYDWFNGNMILYSIINGVIIFLMFIFMSYSYNKQVAKQNERYSKMFKEGRKRVNSEKFRK